MHTHSKKNKGSKSRREQHVLPHWQLSIDECINTFVLSQPSPVVDCTALRASNQHQKRWEQQENAEAASAGREQEVYTTRPDKTRLFASLIASQSKTRLGWNKALQEKQLEKEINIHVVQASRERKGSKSRKGSSRATTTAAVS